jgi:glutamate carboxypeptidase
MSDRTIVARRSAAVDARLDAAREHLRTLVCVNSFTRNRDGVNESGRLVANMFAPLGFAPTYVPSSDPGHGEHLVLRRRGRSRASVLLVSHLDTVYTPEIEALHAFRFRREDDRIYGPGVADIKGGTVLAHLALSVLACCDPDMLDAISWTVLLDAAEEEGSPDFPGLLREHAGDEAIACLVLEHGNDTEDGGTAVTSSRRGSARFVLETRGRQAHAGSAHPRGINAIRELARLIERIESMTSADGSVTFNVGRIGGGLGSNTVPDRAWCEVDLRADREEPYERAVAAIMALGGAGTVTSRHDGLGGSIHVTRCPSYPPWPGNPGSRGLAAIAREAGLECGLTVTDEHRLGASDGSHAWDLVPTLDGLGPIGVDLHSAEHAPEQGKRQESMRWSSMRERALLAVALFSRLARGERPA